MRASLFRLVAGLASNRKGLSLRSNDGNVILNKVKDLNRFYFFASEAISLYVFLATAKAEFAAGAPA